MTDAHGADLSNWRTAPFSGWSFRNVGAIVPTAPIPAAGEAWELPVAPASLAGFELKLTNGASLDIDGFRRQTASDALVVLNKGRIVYEAYDNGNSEHAPHILMSATKSVVGLISGIVAGRGDIDVDAPVASYVPEVGDGAYRDATIRQLLDMRTGIAFDPAQQAAYSAATGWEPAEPGHGLHAFFTGLAPSDQAHGGPFSYVSANTDLLGWAIERATGSSLADLASEVLWQPLGAVDDAAITTDLEGAPRCTGGFVATARDFARVGQLVLQHGARDGRQIVPADWIADIETGGDAEAWRQGEFAAAFGARRMRYRSGWYVVDDAPQMIFAMGIHGQNLFVDRGNDLVIAKLSSQGAPLEPRAMGLTHRAVSEIRRCLVA